MPAPEIAPLPGRPALGHVNLMADTLIANASPDDLRAIIRNLLASGSPALASAFTKTARSRLRNTASKALSHPPNLFTKRSSDGHASPGPELPMLLARVRALYGAGMGFASLSFLSSIVAATIGVRWDEDDAMADALAMVDADISQAIQSCKEEIEAGRVSDTAAAREAVEDLRSAVRTSLADVKSWGGEFPFERALTSLEIWKI